MTSMVCPPISINFICPVISRPSCSSSGVSEVYDQCHYMRLFFPSCQQVISCQGSGCPDTTYASRGGRLHQHWIDFLVGRYASELSLLLFQALITFGPVCTPVVLLFLQPEITLAVAALLQLNATPYDRSADQHRKQVCPVLRYLFWTAPLSPQE